MKSKILRATFCLVLIGTMMATQVGVVAAWDDWDDLWEDVTDKTDDLWDDVTDKTDDLWDDITDEYPEHLGGWGQQTRNLIDQMPQEAKDWLVAAVDEAATIVMPIPAIVPGAPVTLAKISLTRGTVEIYEPSTEEVITVLTNKALDYMSGGKVNVEKIEELSVKEIGDQKYKTNIDAKVKLLGFIPITVEYEATVKVDGREGIQVLDADRPWWNIFVL